MKFYCHPVKDDAAAVAVGSHVVDAHATAVCKAVESIESKTTEPLTDDGCPPRYRSTYSYCEAHSSLSHQDGTTLAMVQKPGRHKSQYIYNE